MTGASLLTAEEAAKEVHVCTKTLGRLRRAGLIRFVAVAGRKFLYHPDDCEAYLDSVRRFAEVARPAPPQAGKRTARVVAFPGKTFAEIHG